MIKASKPVQKSLPFSPNWYTHQICLDIPDLGLLAFGSNEKVHLINQKDFSFFQELIIDKQQDNKESKINKCQSLVYQHNQLIAGYNGCLRLHIYDKNQNIFVFHKQIQIDIDIFNLHLLEKNQLLCHSKNASQVLIDLSTNKIIEKQKNKNNQRLKKIHIDEKYGTIFLFENGIVQLNNQQISLNKKLLCADIYNDKLLLITKFEEQKMLELFQIELQDNQLKLNKIYGKQLQIAKKKEKKNDDKGCFQIKQINERYILVGGKKGELFILDQDKLSSEQEIVLQQESVDLYNELNYITIENNPHQSSFFQISIEREKNKVICVSLDRQISIWEWQRESLHLIKSIQTLDNKITRLHQHHQEQNLVFMLNFSGEVSCWDILKKGNDYDISRMASLTQIVRMASHPQIESILLLSQNNSAGHQQTIIVYDYVQTSILNRVRFMQPHNIVYLNYITQQEYEIFKQNKTVVEKTKQVKTQNGQKIDGYVILIITDDGQSVSVDGDRIEQLDIGLSFKQPVNSLNLFMKANKLFLMAGEYKTGLIKSITTLSQNKDIISTHQHHKNGITNIQFNKRDEIKCACASFDRSISVYSWIDDGMQMTYILKHKWPVIKIDWNVNDYLLAIGYRNNTIQLYNCQTISDTPIKQVKQEEQEEEEEEERVKRVAVNRQQQTFRQHQGYILDAQFDLIGGDKMLSCSDDHTVKQMKID